jgi:hypothetical protein
MANPSRKEYAAAWRKANREKINKYERWYRANFSEKYKASGRKRRRAKHLIRIAETHTIAEIKQVLEIKQARIRKEQ